MASHTADSPSIHLPVHGAAYCLIAVAEWAIEVLLQLGCCLQEHTHSKHAVRPRNIPLQLTLYMQQDTSLTTAGDRIKAWCADGQRCSPTTPAGLVAIHNCSVDNAMPTFLGGGLALLFRLPMTKVFADRGACG